MNENDYKNMSEIIQKSLADIPESCFKLSQDSIKALQESVKAISTVINHYQLSEQLIESAKTLSALSKVTLANIEPITISPHAFDFLKNIDFQSEYVNLTEDDCDTINTILESSNTTDTPAKISKRKMTLADFIKTVLIPILAILLPMIQNSYLNKVNSIESQKAYIEELQLKEEELQIKERELHIAEQQLQNDIEQKEILENILTEIQNFSEYFEFLPEAPEYPDEVHNHFDEFPESLDEVPSSPADTCDTESTVHDAPSN